MLKLVGEMLQVGETKNEYKKRVEKARKKTFWKKRLHDNFMTGNFSEVADERLWLLLLRAGYLGKSTSIHRDTFLLLRTWLCKLCFYGLRLGRRM